MIHIKPCVWHEMCGSRKYPYPPPPRKVTGNSEGEGGSKAQISEGSVGVHGKLLFQRVKKHVKIESNARLIPRMK